MAALTGEFVGASRRVEMGVMQLPVCGYSMFPIYLCTPQLAYLFTSLC